MNELTGGRVVEFEGQVASTFTLFITWLHTGFLVPLPASANAASEDDLERLVAGPDVGEHSDQVADIDLARLITFAEDELIPQLKLTALAILHSQNTQHDRTSSKGAIKHLLATFRGESRIRSYLAEEAAVFLNPDNVSSKLFDFPQEYIQDAMNIVLRERDLGEFYPKRMTRGAWGSRSMLLYHRGDKEFGEDHLTDAIGKAKIRPMPSSEIHDDYHSDVIIVVGFERLRFRVHKGLVQKYSDYCRGALRTGFPEAERNEIDFREESVRNFAMFLDFVYDQQIYLPSLKDLRAYDKYSNELKRDLRRWKERGGGDW